MALVDHNFNLSHRVLHEPGQPNICGEYHRDDLLAEEELCKFAMNQNATCEKR